MKITFDAESLVWSLMIGSLVGLCTGFLTYFIVNR
jgi:hypothetical protein